MSDRVIKCNVSSLFEDPLVEWGVTIKHPLHLEFRKFCPHWSGGCGFEVYRSDLTKSLTSSKLLTCACSQLRHISAVNMTKALTVCTSV
jgi:hypothetical protein